jgi:hypothetical protein
LASIASVTLCQYVAFSGAVAGQPPITGYVSRVEYSNLYTGPPTVGLSFGNEFTSAKKVYASMISKEYVSTSYMRKPELTFVSGVTEGPIQPVMRA